MRRRGADPLIGIVAFAVLAPPRRQRLPAGPAGRELGRLRRPDRLRAGHHPTPGRAHDPGPGARRRGPDGRRARQRLRGGRHRRHHRSPCCSARSIVRWIPSLLPPVAAYGIWCLTYRDDIRPKPELEPSKLARHPVRRVPGRAHRGRGGHRACRPPWPRSSSSPSSAGSCTCSCRRRFDLFDSIMLLHARHRARACWSSSGSRSTTRRPPPPLRLLGQRSCSGPRVRPPHPPGEDAAGPGRPWSCVGVGAGRRQHRPDEGRHRRARGGGPGGPAPVGRRPPR